MNLAYAKRPPSPGRGGVNQVFYHFGNFTEIGVNKF